MAGEKRAAARERITAELMAAARAQLAEVGAAGLSLRGVARSIGMVSSAVYRYVESRDELLTRLITEAYNSLGEAAETASQRAWEERPSADLDRWLAIALAVRRWALEHPHEYLLLYGSPVPGYAAPDSTVEPGTRVIYALVAVVINAFDEGRLETVAGPQPDLDADLATELVAAAAGGDRDINPVTVLAFVAAWTQMFGLISFELNNQTRELAADQESLFTATVWRLAHQIGLR